MQNFMKEHILVLSIVLSALAVSSAFEFPVFKEEDNNVTVLDKANGHFRPKDSNMTKGVYVWLIQPNEAKHHVKGINLFFEELFLHEYDMVTIFKDVNDSYDDTKSIVKPIKSQNGSITVTTDLTSLVVKIQGNYTFYQRKFDCYYSSDGCFVTLPPDARILHSPIYTGTNSSFSCKYTYNKDPHRREKPLFQFDVFDFTSSTVDLEHTTYPLSSYNKGTPMDFFPVEDHNAMSFTVNVNNKTDYFRLLIRPVDKACSDFILSSDTNPKPIRSPNYVLDNGTLGSECVWVIKHNTASEILGLSFVKLHFANVLDIIAINDGASFNSPPLYQVTTSSANNSFNRIVRSSGPYLWVAFKPVTYISEMVANITVHGQGGHFNGSGEISMKGTDGHDTVFMLEVEKDKNVLLTFSDSNFQAPYDSVSIYDGFDFNHLITTIQNNVSYPIISQSSQMMVIANTFSKGSFKAAFKGVPPGCMKMSTPSNDNYVLSGNCNNTCNWIIPPQEAKGSELILHLQYISLDKEDSVEIYQLDATKTVLGNFSSSVMHVPKISIPAHIGATVKVTRKMCSKPDDVVLIGHTSLIPECGGVLDLKARETFHITSPLFPDTYPVLSQCSWTLVTPKNSLIHLAFDKMALAPDHWVSIFNSKNNVTSQYTGSELPDDLFVSNGSIVRFNSGNSKPSPLQLVSSEGFLLNGTVAECGSVEEGPGGNLTVNVSLSTQALCIWKISVPLVKDSVNIIAYKISKKEDKGNYEMKIFDGASVREPQIVNDSSSSEIWSRKDSIIVLYKRLNVSEPSTVFVINYKTISCNTSMLCENKLCMHPDWKCNGVNDCGDYSDEKNCDTSPPPPIIKQYGYTATTFWITIFCMLAVGTLLGFGVPFFYEKYKNQQYSRFGDISVIE